MHTQSIQDPLKNGPLGDTWATLEFGYLLMPTALISMPKAMAKESMFEVDAGPMPMPMSTPHLPILDALWGVRVELEAYLYASRGKPGSILDTRWEIRGELETYCNGLTACTVNLGCLRGNAAVVA